MAVDGSGTHDGSGAPLRRLGVVGDIHGQFAALQAALACLRDANADAIAAVGDVVDGPGDVGACLETLRHEHVVTVRGNHERWFLHGEQRDRSHATTMLSATDRQYLASWPAAALLPTVAGPVLVCHGVGDHDLAELRPSTRGFGLSVVQAAREDAPELFPNDLFAAVGGHTHERMLRRIQGNWFINAGTLLPESEPGFLLLDFDQRALTWFNLDPQCQVTRGETHALDAPTGETRPCPETHAGGGAHDGREEP